MVLPQLQAVGSLAAEALRLAASLGKPGVTTNELDAAIHEFMVSQGAYPSPLGYRGYPKSICTSVNECVCHGIPDLRPLEEGDIVNVDITVFKDGYHGDTSATFGIGSLAPHAEELLQVTKACLDVAIAVCGPGVPYKHIGEVIQREADSHGMSVVREFVGHGIGRHFHSLPVILHYRNSRPGSMREGETFTIEPMLTLGSRHVRTWPDGWTVVTRDGSLSAQYEHTLIVTQEGVSVLTEVPRDVGVTGTSPLLQ